MNEEDAAEFEHIIAKYKEKGIAFLHRGLIGAEWQRAIAEVDALLLPYSAERYRYQCSAMLFTAIGFQKPVLVSDDMNPDVFARFPIGITFPSGKQEALRTALETFINEYDQRCSAWHRSLVDAGQYYAPARVAAQIMDVIEGNDRSVCQCSTPRIINMTARRRSRQ